MAIGTLEEIFKKKRGEPISEKKEKESTKITQLMIAFGESVRKAREAKGISMRQLAERTGISANNISNIEKGKQNVRCTTIERLATGLGMEARLILKEKK